MNKNKYISKTFSMPVELFERFIDYCNENNINRSAQVQDLIEQWLKGKMAK